MGCRLLLARRGDGQVWLLLPVAIELWSHVDIAKISMEFNCAAGLWLSVEKMRESKEMGLKFFFFATVQFLLVELQFNFSYNSIIL